MQLPTYGWYRSYDAMPGHNPRSGNELERYGET